MTPTAGALHLISSRLDRGEIDSDQFLEAFTRTLTRLIGSSRAGVWIFVGSPQAHHLRCLALFDAVRNDMAQATDLCGEHNAPYFEALARDGLVNAPDAWNDPATVGFRAEYLEPMNIRSMLDVGFSINGTPVGVFSCEEVGTQRAWTGRQVQLLRAIGPRAALSLLKANSRSLDTAPGALWEPKDPAALLTRVPPLQG